MALTGLETIALIVSVLVLLKLVFVLFSKKTWLKVAETFWSKPTLLAWLVFILAAIIFFYLIQEMTIIQIMASLTFGALLMSLAFTAYSKEILGMGKKILSKGFPISIWISIIIWAALAIWTLYVVFA